MLCFYAVSQCVVSLSAPLGQDINTEAFYFIFKSLMTVASRLRFVFRSKGLLFILEQML